MQMEDEDNDPNFYADSGATTHITNDSGNITKIAPYKGNKSLYVGNGESLKITRVSETNIKTNHGNLNLKNVLVVPDIKKNLLSIGKLTNDNSCTIEFS